jgi:DNA-binding MarR family transcriptional regulator
MTVTDIYPLAQQTIQALDGHYRSAMNQAMAGAGLEGRFWPTLLYAQGVEPQPLTAMRLQSFSPYTTVAMNEARLAESANAGWLKLAGDGGYRLTDAGRAALKGSFDAVHQALVGVEPLPTNELRRLAELLRRIVDASLQAALPAGKPHLRASRHTEPGESAPVAALIDQYITDLIGFRDDVHPAIWQRLAVSGPEWEALTLVWRDEVGTAAELAEKLGSRRLSEADYTEELRRLAGRGWVAERSGRYGITDAGRAVREQAEAATDAMFYEPWRCLDTDEAHELRSLLTRLRDGASQAKEVNNS